MAEIRIHTPTICYIFIAYIKTDINMVAILPIRVPLKVEALYNFSSNFRYTTRRRYLAWGREVFWLNWTAKLNLLLKDSDQWILQHLIVRPFRWKKDTQEVKLNEEHFERAQDEDFQLNYIRNKSLNFRYNLFTVLWWYRLQAVCFSAKYLVVQW